MLVIFSTLPARLAAHCLEMPITRPMNHMHITITGGSGCEAAGRRAGSLAPEAGRERREFATNQGELWVLLEEFLAIIIKAVGGSAGAVRMLSPNGMELQMVGAIGLPPDVCRSESIVGLDCGACGKAVYSRDVCSSDAKDCSQRYGCHFFGGECRYVVAVPLKYRGDQIGVFTIFFAAAQDVPDDVARIFRSFAELIGIALESARQNRESRRASQMVERQMIANEIHDSLAQTLVYTKMRMSLLMGAMQTHNEPLALECAHDVDDALQRSQKTVRELIKHFRCQMDPLGLQHALQELVNEFGSHTGIAIGYANWVADLDLPLEHELQVFHIVREALANVARHSGATRARLAVGRSGGNYVFTVEDNGSGGCTATPIEGHYGLMIMRERARRIGGEIEVKSSERTGTRVRLSFPDPDLNKEEIQ
ncbi:MAG: GAF domain-containing protein [Nitrosomonadales bacterium]|nr:GAF domain-containing protein [Nitrosomonadales bacterium]